MNNNSTLDLTANVRDAKKYKTCEERLDVAETITEKHGLYAYPKFMMVAVEFAGFTLYVSEISPFNGVNENV